MRAVARREVGHEAKKGRNLTAVHPAPSRSRFAERHRSLGDFGYGRLPHRILGDFGSGLLFLISRPVRLARLANAVCLIQQKSLIWDLASSATAFGTYQREIENMMRFQTGAVVLLVTAAVVNRSSAEERRLLASDQPRVAKTSMAEKPKYITRLHNRPADNGQPAVARKRDSTITTSRPKNAR